MKIPLLDLKAQFETIKDEVLPAVMGVVESQRFIMGEQVRELEEAVAAACGSRFGIACASGTDALLLSLRTLDLQPGDEVITTPFTFFATAGAIHNAGGRVVFVDIDPTTFNLDVDQARAAVTSRTRAIVPVHLFGQMASMECVLQLAEQHGLAVIEDAAQAMGARRNVNGAWRNAGALGMTGALSFFPSKNLGGWGDGGMIITQDAQLAERLRKLRTHGGAKQYHHEEVGTNSRLDTVQAAVLLTKLQHLGDWNAARRHRARIYSEALSTVDGVVPPATDPANEHIFNQYTVRARRRDQLKEHLLNRDIGCAVYYPRPLHLQPCFASLGFREGQFPEAERACREVLSLPVYPELSERQQEAVIGALREFYA
ncbi:MAG: aminotransferase class I/II-fold pyridoxal phosphate-dependent enzyme [Gemmatimonadales bacterium]|nr:aminotransferase class I/II-fold pyridoxal phosphate-dependent enzyme [Gemmatimonadales bacterium]NIN13512.1 aminotransferase class I/II-fold pyridoxal phosphate-dependent enzyme [Gemmatimonadales bacterium]NIN51506.1 aminotransferase class I/II-fold pyridoxal phosphate-dependent enzyme [Gemmatimonadales bacterium]NIP08970.1 aminotransferase class I/II-fold pyridoxal phosphate-dependent enzyme [Gemmatimonadales bacterium]NIR03748.1 aminotransferase class I/II-fold pyridoxal phosphate-depende